MKTDELFYYSPQGRFYLKDAESGKVIKLPNICHFHFDGSKHFKLVLDEFSVEILRSVFNSEPLESTHLNQYRNTEELYHKVIMNNAKLADKSWILLFEGFNTASSEANMVYFSCLIRFEGFGKFELISDGFCGLSLYGSVEESSKIIGFAEGIEIYPKVGMGTKREGINLIARDLEKVSEDLFSITSAKVTLNKNGITKIEKFREEEEKYSLDITSIHVDGERYTVEEPYANVIKFFSRFDAHRIEKAIDKNFEKLNSMLSGVVVENKSSAEFEKFIKIAEAADY